LRHGVKNLQQIQIPKKKTLCGGINVHFDRHNTATARYEWCFLISSYQIAHGKKTAREPRSTSAYHSKSLEESVLFPPVAILASVRVKIVFL
jgi:hypothetical protein